MRLTLIIGGVSFTAAANRLHYSCELVDRYGPNGGVLADGTSVVDLLARKLRVTWPLNALTTTELAQLLTVCSGADVLATTFDPRTNADAQHWFHPTISQGRIVWSGNGTTRYVTGAVLTLEEK